MVVARAPVVVEAVVEVEVVMGIGIVVVLETVDSVGLHSSCTTTFLTTEGMPVASLTCSPLV